MLGSYYFGNLFKEGVGINKDGNVGISDGKRWDEIFKENEEVENEMRDGGVKKFFFLKNKLVNFVDV